MTQGSLRVLLLSFASFAAALILAAPTSAQTVSSTVETSVAGVVVNDPQGPVVGGDVTSFVEPAGAFTLDFTRDGYGRASQRSDGVGAVVANALFANGNNLNVVEARTLWTDSATNTSGSPIVYEFSYLIHPPSLRIGDFAGLSDTSSQAVKVSFDLRITSNGSVVFESTAEMVGGFVSHVLNETGTGLSPVAVGGGTTFGYDFSAASGILNLGSFNPGETCTVEYEMVARVETFGLEAGGLAQVGDPFDLDGTPGFTGQFLADGAVAVEDASWGEVKSQY